MSKLTEKEERHLDSLELFFKKYERIFYVLIGIGFPLLVILDLFTAFKFSNSDPIKSRDHFWLAGIFGSWTLLVIRWNLERKELFLIIQKLRKR